MRLCVILILTIFITASCKKIKTNELEGEWKVTQWANHKPDNPATFNQSSPYWFLQRYAQGIRFNDNKTFHYRYFDGTEWRTEELEYGTWKLKRTKIEFSIPNGDRIVADIEGWDDRELWIKYREGAGVLEYKMVKE